jgi:transcriptional regulator with XRE-family HTH domain
VPHPGGAIKIGQKIREVRRAQCLTLYQFAQKVGLTQAAISQIERDRSNPSIGALKAIADALSITIGSLFDSEPAAGSLVVRPTERKLLSPRRGIRYYLLTPDLNGRVEFILSEYDRGATTGELRYAHAGEECGLVLKGRLEVHVGEETYLLKAGDSIRFDCSVPHRLTNVGTGVVRCIWAVSPPSF